MFPDRASLYVVAIEDRQYKDFKIHCKFTLCMPLTNNYSSTLFKDTNKRR